MRWIPGTLAAIGMAAVPAAAQPAPTPQIDVLASSPVVTDTELQVICLFRSSPRNKFSGALALADTALKGLLTKVRGPGRFEGQLGETLVVTPPPGTMAARHVMLVGLGDTATFSPLQMRLVGKTVVREADRLGVTHPFFAPTVKDGGVGRFTTGEIAAQFVAGAMEAYRMAQWLQSEHANTGPKVAQITYLAGADNKASTEEGVRKGLAETPAAP